MQLSERAGGVQGTSNYQLLSSQRQQQQQGKHLRNNSTSDIKSPTNPTTHDIRPTLKTSRHLSFPTDHSSQPRPVDLSPSPSSEETPHNNNNSKITTKRNTKPITRNQNGSSYPPLSMITRGYTQDSSSTSTTNWVAQQSITTLNPSSANNNDHENPPSSSPLQPHPNPPQSIADNAAARAPIKVAPIRGFKSSRRSAEMTSRRTSEESGSARVYETNENLHRRSRQSEPDEHNSDESDLFLRTAREEELAQQQNTVLNTNGNSPNRRVRSSFLVLLLHSCHFLQYLPRFQNGGINVAILHTFLLPVSHRVWTSQATLNLWLAFH